MQRLERLFAWIFGLSLLALALAVAVETIMRKVFNRSLQGVDELGGYILAVAAGLSFAIALRSRTHIRIDIVHDLLPRWLRIALNILAMASIAACAAAAAYMAWLALADTILFSSTAQTPWATPLKYPQSAWVAALVMFAIVAAWELIVVLTLLLRGGGGEIDRRYGPRGAKDELEEELEDLKARSAGTITPGKPA